MMGRIPIISQSAAAILVLSMAAIAYFLSEFPRLDTTLLFAALLLGIPHVLSAFCAWILSFFISKEKMARIKVVSLAVLNGILATALLFFSTWLLWPFHAS